MAKFYEQFLDPGLTADLDWSEHDEEEAQRQRLMEAALKIMHAKELPRRLGGDASAAELSADKKVAKAVLNRLITCLRMWGGEPADVTEAYLILGPSVEPHPSVDPQQTPSSMEIDGREFPLELLQQGAQLEWDAFWADHKAYLQNRVRIVVTNAAKLGKSKVANSFANRFQNEYDMLSDVLETQ